MSFGTFFLHAPERFPDASQGAAWGTEALCIGIGGIEFAFTGLSVCQAAYARRIFADFLVEAPVGTPVETRIRRADPADFRPITTPGWVYTLDLDYRPACVRIAGLKLTALVSWQPALGAILWSASEDDADFALIFGNVFRLLSAYAVIQQGGVILHSAGIADGRSAWMGFGHSGAGKSTFSGLALDAGWSVLSDDLNVLRPRPGSDVRSDRPIGATSDTAPSVPQPADSGWTAQRVPFAGELGPTRGDGRPFPIAGLCRLRQGAEHRLDPMDRASAAAALVACAPYVNNDPYRVVDLLANLQALVGAVPCQSLTFRRDAGFLPLLCATGDPR